MRNFNHTLAAFALAFLFLLIAGCGGGGGGSDPAIDDPNGDDGQTATMDCPSGQMKNDAGECVATPPPGPTDEARNAEGMALAKAIGGDDLPDAAAADITGIATSGKPASNSKFSKSSMMPADISGWMPSAYERDNTADPKSSDLVAVYSNEEPPKQTAYNKVYVDAASSDIVGISSIEKGVIAFDAGTTSAAAAFSSKIKGAFFDAVLANSSRNAVVDDEDTATVKENEHKGTFDTVPGTFACTGASGCTVSRDAAGTLSLGPDWTFTPAAQQAGDAMYTVPVADADYLRFGFWKNTAMNDKDETVFMVAPLYGGTQPITDLSVVTGSGFEGKATYEGKATGKYVRKTFTSDNEVEHLFPGQFTADVDLTAYFGGTAIAADDQHSVQGKITSFMDGNSEIDSSWSVSLKRGGFGSGDSPTEGVFTGMTEGDKNMMGAWEGQFFGAAPVLDSDENKDGNQHTFPTGVAGAFNGHFTNGHVLGAFGAAAQDN